LKPFVRGEGLKEGDMTARLRSMMPVEGVHSRASKLNRGTERELGLIIGLRGFNHQSSIINHQSSISNQQSAISNQQSAISTQQSAISNQQSAISNQQS
jgi:hypothetical protein